MPPATASNSQQALQNLQQYQSGMLSPADAVSKANDQFGVNAASGQVQGLRGAIQNTTNLLGQIAPGVMGRTGNSLVSAAQANRQIQNEQTPVQAQLSGLNTNYNNANSDYERALGEAQTQANATLGGQQNQLSYLQNIYSDLTGSEQAQRDESYRQAQLAEQQREANLSADTSRATSAASVASPSIGGLGASTGNMSRNSAGGYSFTGNGGVPITMAQYLAQNGYQTAGEIAQAAASLLGQGTTSDKQVAAAIQSGKYTPAQLAARYPQVFGGSF